LPDGSSNGSLIGLLPRPFRSAVACPTACQTDYSSACSSLPLVGSLPDGLPVASPDGLLVGSLGSLPAIGQIARRLTRSFRSSVDYPTARRTDCSSACSSLPLVGLLVPSSCQQLARWLARRIARRLTRSFRSSVACVTARRTDSLSPRSGAAQRLAGWIARWLTRSFRSSVACPTARQTDSLSARSAACPMARRADRSLAYSFLPLVGGLRDTSPDG
jgi:hypothetical protein